MSLFYLFYLSALPPPPIGDLGYLYPNSQNKACRAPDCTTKPLPDQPPNTPPSTNNARITLSLSSDMSLSAHVL